MWSGLLIGIGLIIVMQKLSINWKLRITTYEVTTDVLAFVLVNLLHAGAGTGGPVHAAIAAAVVSVYVSWLRKRIGYWNKDEYVPGKRNVSTEIE